MGLLPCYCVRVSESIYRNLTSFFIFTFIELVNLKQNPINFRSKDKTLLYALKQYRHILVFEQYCLKIMAPTFIEMNVVYAISSSDLGNIVEHSRHYSYNLSK